MPVVLKQQRRHDKCRANEVVEIEVTIMRVGEFTVFELLGTTIICVVPCRIHLGLYSSFKKLHPNHIEDVDKNLELKIY